MELVFGMLGLGEGAGTPATACLTSRRAGLCLVKAGKAPSGPSGLHRRKLHTATVLAWLHDPDRGWLMRLRWAAWREEWRTYERRYVHPI